MNRPDGGAVPPDRLVDDAHHALLNRTIHSLQGEGDRIVGGSPWARLLNMYSTGTRTRCGSGCPWPALDESYWLNPGRWGSQSSVSMIGVRARVHRTSGGDWTRLAPLRRMILSRSRRTAGLLDVFRKASGSERPLVCGHRAKGCGRYHGSFTSFSHLSVSCAPPDVPAKFRSGRKARRRPSARGLLSSLNSGATPVRAGLDDRRRAIRVALEDPAAQQRRHRVGDGVGRRSPRISGFGAPRLRRLPPSSAERIGVSGVARVIGSVIRDSLSSARTRRSPGGGAFQPASGQDRAAAITMTRAPRPAPSALCHRMSGSAGEVRAAKIRPGSGSPVVVIHG